MKTSEAFANYVVTTLKLAQVHRASKLASKLQVRATQAAQVDLFSRRDIRVAAQRADRSSEHTRGHSHDRPLEVWEAVVNGSYSVIEWFDTDTRRIIVIRANPPNAHDPRRLTKQEREVAGHAASGEANKVIARRLDVSPTRVSALLCSAVRKLDLQNKAQLVYWVRGLGLPVRRRGRETFSPACRSPVSDGGVQLLGRRRA